MLRPAMPKTVRRRWHVVKLTGAPCSHDCYLGTIGGPGQLIHTPERASLASGWAGVGLPLSRSSRSGRPL